MKPDEPQKVLFKMAHTETVDRAIGVEPPVEDEIFDATELDQMEFEAVKYVIPGVFVEGLTLFCGKPKVGKSWLLLHAAHAVAGGGYTLGDTHCIEGDVLVCSLEDNKRRLQNRMQKLFGGRPKSPRLKFKVKMPRLAQGGLETLRQWIKSVPNPRLIVIDTLAMVRMPNRKEQSTYDADYTAVIELRNLALEFGLAIVVVHHLRKMPADDAFDTVSGTLGLTGCPDSIVILKREPTGTTLLGRGRDLEEFEKAIVFDKGNCLWRIEGDATELRRSTQQREILEAMRELQGPQTPLKIARHLGKQRDNVTHLLRKLAEDGIVRKVNYGQYEIAPKTENEDE